jgi:hypothetical protein
MSTDQVADLTDTVKKAIAAGSGTIVVDTEAKQGLAQAALGRMAPHLAAQISVRVDRAVTKPMLEAQRKADTRNATEWAVIGPDGTVGWLPPGSTDEAKAIAGGPAGGCASMPVTDDGRLWLIAGRAAKFHPRDYPENLLAQGVVTALSGGRSRDRLCGHIALAECDPDTASFDPEEIRPLPMSPEMATRVMAAIDEAAQSIVEQTARQVQDRLLELQETVVAGSPADRVAGQVRVGEDTRTGSPDRGQRRHGTGCARFRTGRSGARCRACRAADGPKACCNARRPAKPRINS